MNYLNFIIDVNAIDHCLSIIILFLHDLVC